MKWDWDTKKNFYGVKSHVRKIRLKIYKKGQGIWRKCEKNQGKSVIEGVRAENSAIWGVKKGAKKTPFGDWKNQKRPSAGNGEGS